MRNRDLSDRTESSYAASATATRKKRGPSLSRRSGQNGSVFQKTTPWNPKAPTYGRFWIDLPDMGRRQKTIALGPCTSRTIARQKLREHIESTGINSREQFHASTT